MMMSTKASEQAAKKLGIMMTSRSSTNGQTAKRLVIKNLKSLYKLKLKINFLNNCKKFIAVHRNEEDSFCRLWKNIEEAVCAIHESKPVSMSLEMLYQSVENLCTEKKSSILYSALKQLCDQHIQRELPKLTLYPFKFFFKIKKKNLI